MSQNYNWPAVSVNTTNPSVALNNASPSATSSTLVAGQDPSGDQQALQTALNGDLLVQVTSSILPTGGATAANQVLQTTQLTGIHSDTTSLDGKTVHVDTGAVVVASSALPSGASTSALQTSGNASLTSLDGKTVHVDTGAVVITSSALPSGAATSAKQDTGNTSLASLDGKTVHVDTGAVVISSSALPSGASTSALQTSGNTSLSSIDTKTPALGQALAAASVPIVLTASQLSTLTPLTSVTVTQATGTNLHTVVDSSALPTGAATSANQTNGTQKSQISTPTALTVTQAAKTVGTSAVRLTVSGSAPAATRVVLVANPDSTSTAKFYIGSASVTNSGATRGVQLVAGQSFIANNDAGDYYIVSDTAAQTVEIMEQS